MGLVKRGNVVDEFDVSGSADTPLHRNSESALAESIMAKMKVQLSRDGISIVRRKNSNLRRINGSLRARTSRQVASRADRSGLCQALPGVLRGRTLAEITPKVIVAYKNRRYAVGMKAASINRELTVKKGLQPRQA